MYYCLYELFLAYQRVKVEDEWLKDWRLTMGFRAENWGEEILRKWLEEVRGKGVRLEEVVGHGQRSKDAIFVY